MYDYQDKPGFGRDSIGRRTCSLGSPKCRITTICITDTLYQGGDNFLCGCETPLLIRWYSERTGVELVDILLIIDYLLSVYSGFRFHRQAVEPDKSLCVIHRGLTRADDIADIKIEEDCEAVLD